MRGTLKACAAVAALVLIACSQPIRVAERTPAPRPPTPIVKAPRDAPNRDPSPKGTTSPAAPPRYLPPVAAVAPPAWLGTRVLPRAQSGYGEVRPTPRILRNRRLVTTDRLPPPADWRFAATVQPVPEPVAARSTWRPGCPVGLDELRYVTVSFWGFDNRPHTGELLVNAASARDLVRVFKRLYRARFPIEEMRIVSPIDVQAPPTGDGNNSTAFVCRPARGSTSWSEHAFGLAVDINPFHNPYVEDDVMLPELASAYVDRSRRRPGMHFSDGPAVRAFDAIGWTWGGTWNDLADWMHFSANGH